MKTLSEKVAQCFQRVRHVNEYHWENGLNPGLIPVSVEDLQWVIEQIYHVEVEKFTVSYTANFVRAMYERYADGTVKIYVQNDLSDHWKRYLATKELCHVVIDDDEDFEPNGCEIIEHLITAEALRVIDDKSSGDVRSEKLAEIMALELLYPHELRKPDAEKLNAKETTLALLAEHYGIPEFLIAWVLHAEYLTWCDLQWENIRSMAKRTIK